MARGDPAFPLENLVPYMRGGRFAVIALRHRHRRHDADLATDADRYIEMSLRYEEAAKATFRLRRERTQG
ncbi:MAG TPA: hypothetical protein VNG93_06345 [Candidatus Dormibacteraeota bacterium]|nr:hypothetical protein [Candidatus Dormibacteraeota bacterium]